MIYIDEFNVFNEKAVVDIDAAKSVAKTNLIKAMAIKSILEGHDEEENMALLTALETCSTQTVDQFNSVYEAWTQQQANVLVSWVKDYTPSTPMTYDEFGDRRICDLVALDPIKDRALPLSYFLAKDAIYQHPMAMAHRALMKHL